MKDAQPNAIATLPHLLKWANQFLKNVGDCFPSLTCSTGDSFGLMAVLYLIRQHGHLDSICALFESRDCSLISRSMVEGLIQLKWAEEMPAERALQWRNYERICEWITLVSQPEQPDQDQKDEIEEKIKIYEKAYRIRRFRNVSGIPTDPNAYHKNWRCGIQIKDMCPYNLKPLYDFAYQDFSDWSHWGTKSLSESLIIEGGKITFNHIPPRPAAMALICGIQCLIQTSDVANTWKGGGLFQEVEDLANAYCKWSVDFGINAHRPSGRTYPRVLPE